MARASMMRRHARLFSFFGVLLLSSSLVVLLFEQARAVDVVVEPTGNLGPGENGIIVNVEIPDGQRVPIESREAEIRKGSDFATADVQVIASCDGATTDCDETTLVRVGVKATALVAINFVGAFVNGDQTDEDDAFGYGYLTDGEANDGYGYGYGYEGKTLSMRYEVRFLACGADGLSAGKHFLEFTAKSGSVTLGDFESAPEDFTISCGGGGGGPPSPPGPPGPPGPPSPPPPPIQCPPDCPTPPPIPLPPGGGPITIPGLGLITINLAPEVQGASLVVTSVGTSPPPGVPNAPPTFGPALFMDIDVENAPPGGVIGGTFTFTLSAAQLAQQDPLQVVLIHFGNAWVSVPTNVLSVNPDGSATFTALLPGFSPFAIVFDRAPPTVGNVTPAPNATVGARPLFSAALDDNRGINTALTRMFVDGQPVQATVTSNLIQFTPAVSLTAGLHTVRVLATDLSGLTTERNWTFTAEPGREEAVVVTPVSPTPNGYTNNTRPLIQATYRSAAGFGPTAAAMSVDGAPAVGAVPTPSGISYTPPVGLVDGQHTVTVTATDLSGNSNFATWTFVVDTVLPIITAVEPPEGSTVTTPRPVVRATCSDAASGIPVAPSITVDGVPVGADGRPTQDLANDPHTAAATCRDGAGNVATQRWTFHVAREAVSPLLLGALIVALLLAVAGGAWWYVRRGRGPGGPPTGP